MPLRISALMDGELSSDEARKLLDSLPKDEVLRAEWDAYHLIGDALRQDQMKTVNLVDRVMTELEQEPVLLAPRPLGRLHSPGTRWAVAAGVAGITLVGALFWLVKSNYGFSGDTPAAQAEAVAAARDMQQYMLAHQAYAPRGPLQGGTYYIRTVALQQTGSAR